MNDTEKLAARTAALFAMWNFASAMVERHGMDGADTMTDADHEAWQAAAYATNAALKGEPDPT